MKLILEENSGLLTWPVRQHNSGRLYNPKWVAHSCLVVSSGHGLQFVSYQSWEVNFLQPHSCTRVIVDLPTAAKWMFAERREKEKERERGSVSNNVWTLGLNCNSKTLGPESKMSKTNEKNGLDSSLVLAVGQQTLALTHSDQGTSLQKNAVFRWSPCLDSADMIIKSLHHNSLHDRDVSAAFSWNWSVFFIKHLCYGVNRRLWNLILMVSIWAVVTLLRAAEGRDARPPPFSKEIPEVLK